ncbi:MAG: ABC transporter permease [Cyclobacteriaceae bacterium]
MNRNDRPPKWIDRLLEWALPPRLYEAVLGDLEEKFRHRLSGDKPIWKIRALYISEGIGFLRMMKRRRYLNPSAMYRNYLLIALRNMIKDRLYVSLNITGLAIGMACVIVIFTYVKFELSYDRFHANADRIYRIPEKFIDDASWVNSAMNHAPMAPIIEENLPGVKHVVRIFPYARFFNAFVASTPDKTFKETGFCFGDSTFFRVFTFESLTGPLGHALNAPYSVVLTRASAHKYFGDVQQAVGQTLIFQNDERSFNFHVTGVIEDIPQTSHFSFEFMASFSSLDQFMPWYNNWHHPSLFLYAEMHQPINPKDLSRQIDRIAAERQPPYVLEEKREYQAQPITDIHLHSNLENEWEPNSQYAYLRIYVITGIFILAIACINFMNISSARSASRAKEVGMRKVLGGKRPQLIAQFLSEAWVYCAVSFILALGMAQLAFIYFFNDVIGKSISLTDVFTLQNLGWSLAFVAGVAAIAGLYPSLFLSGFRPAQALKGKMLSVGSGTLRKGLVTFQFFISCLLISTTLIILRQVDYMKSKDLGFSEEHLISVKLSDRYSQRNYRSLKDALLNESQVSQAALSSTLPGRSDFHGLDIAPEGSEPGTLIAMKTLGGDEDIISTYNLNLLEGRDFSRNIATDATAAFIINEAAAKRLNWDHPIGKELELTVYINGPQKRKGNVIGVVKDFHFESMHHEIEPLLIYINKHPYYADFLSVKFKPGDLAQSVELLQSHWKKFNPEKPIDIRFLNDELQNLYASEQKISQIFRVLAVISILVSCMGLFGLSAFMAEKRMKEVGIRKVMGASASQIVELQVKDFVWLILIANFLMWPLAWWWSQQWLESFAYHIQLNPLVFAITLVVAVGLVVATLAYHSLRAAMANPVHSLRYE